MYMDDIKLFAKNEKKWKQVQTIRINNQERNGILYRKMCHVLLSHSKMISSILQGVLPGVYLLDVTSAAEFGFEKLSRSSEVPFCFFFHPRLFNGIRFQYSEVLVIFIFWFSLDLVVLFLLLFVFFSSLGTWHIFLCKIPFFSPGCLFLLFVSVFNSSNFFCKQLDVVRVHYMINIFFFSCLGDHCIHWWWDLIRSK